jgi:hypothetical protein
MFRSSIQATIVLITLSVFWLVGCSATKTASTYSSGESCIPPIIPFAFPPNERPSIPPVAKNKILPSGSWKVEIALPHPPQGAINFDYISAVRPEANHNEIWIQRQSQPIGNNASLPELSQVLIYRIDTKQWQVLPDQIQGAQARILNLYLSKDGLLFANILISSKVMLGLYDDGNGQFRLINNSENLPNGTSLLDDKGSLWILSHNDGIYSFDLGKDQLRKEINIPDLNVYEPGIYGKMAAFAPDGSLFFLNVRDTGDTELIRYNSTSNKLERDIPYYVSLDPAAMSLYIDHIGNVWLGDRGWMSPDGIWYKIVRSPIFIAEGVPDIPLKYVWVRPAILLESSDNRLWFRSDNGMAWLDPQKGEWCWFTTYQSNIVEDQHHDLWMIADGKLYKDSLDHQ